MQQKTEDDDVVLLTVEVTAKDVDIFESPSTDAERVASTTIGSLLEILEKHEDDWYRSKDGWIRRDACKEVRALKAYHPDHAHHRIALVAVEESEVLENVKARLCQKTGLVSEKMILVCAHRVPEEHKVGNLADYVHWQPISPDATTVDLIDDTFRFVYFGNANEDLRAEFKYNN